MPDEYTSEMKDAAKEYAAEVLDRLVDGLVRHYCPSRQEARAIIRQSVQEL
jgi:hypothetical protein